MLTQGTFGGWLKWRVYILFVCMFLCAKTIEAQIIEAQIEVQASAFVFNSRYDTIYLTFSDPIPLMSKEDCLSLVEIVAEDATPFPVELCAFKSVNRADESGVFSNTNDKIGSGYSTTALITLSGIALNPSKNYRVRIDNKTISSERHQFDTFTINVDTRINFTPEIPPPIVTGISYSGGSNMLISFDTDTNKNAIQKGSCSNLLSMNKNCNDEYEDNEAQYHSEYEYFGCPTRSNMFDPSYANTSLECSYEWIDGKTLEVSFLLSDVLIDLPLQKRQTYYIALQEGHGITAKEGTFEAISDLDIFTIGERDLKTFDRLHFKYNRNPQDISLNRCSKGLSGQLFLPEQTVFNAPFELKFLVQYINIEGGSDGSIFYSVNVDSPLDPFIIPTDVLDSRNFGQTEVRVQLSEIKDGVFGEIWTPFKIWKQERIRTDFQSDDLLLLVETSLDLLALAYGFEAFVPVEYGTNVPMNILNLASNCSFTVRSYTWEKVQSFIPQPFNLGQTSTALWDSFIDPCFIIPELAGSCRFRLSVDYNKEGSQDLKTAVAVTDFEFYSTDSTIAVINGGESKTVAADQPFVLDARRSCKPNVMSPLDRLLCRPLQGLIVSSEIIAENWDPLNPSLLTLRTGLNDFRPRFSAEFGCEICDFFGETYAPNSFCASFCASGNCEGECKAEWFTPFQEFPGGFLKPRPDSYDFKFLTDDGAEATIKLFVVESTGCPIPDIQLSLPKSKVNAGNDLSIEAKVIGTQAATSSWTSEPALQFLGEVVNPYLFIPAGTLTYGAEYTVTFTSTSSCLGNQVQASKAITFAVNIPPSGGTLTIMPLTGKALFDEFTLTTSSWVDLDNDLPLLYSFEYAFVDIGSEIPTEFSKEQTKALVDNGFIQGDTYMAFLPAPLENKKIIVISVAKDQIGAESKRLSINAVTEGLTVLNPALDNNGNFDASVLDTINQATSGSGSFGSITGSVQWGAIATVLNTIKSEDVESNSSAIQGIRETCINGVINSLAGGITPEGLKTASESFSLITEKPEQLNRETVNKTVQTLKAIVSEAQDLLDILSGSGSDPESSGIISEKFQVEILNTVSNILDRFKIDSNNPGRRLQIDNDCDAINTIRETVEELAQFDIKVIKSGAPAKQLNANSVQYTSARRDSTSFGDRSNLQLPGSSGNSVSVPNDIDSVTKFGGDVNVLIVKYDIDVRVCDRINKAPENCSEFETNPDYTGPVSDNAIGSVLSVDIIAVNDSNVKLPVNQTEPFIIELDFPSSGASNVGCEGKVETVVLCGSFDKNENDWNTKGCQVTSKSKENGKVLCSCTHLTDFAAWEAFTDDIEFTAQSDIEKLSFIAVLIVGVFLPLLYVFGMIGWLWAHRKDKLDSKNVQKGALGRLLLARIAMRKKQKQFFENLRSGDFDLKQNEEEIESNKNKLTNTEKNVSWCKTFYLTMKYEHSLFGINRFDPSYSRIQRLSVFLAVVVANLFVASVFFELKDADEVSPGFLFGVILLSAIAVSLPVKFFIKILFKSSANPVGSDSDMAANLYRLAIQTEQGIEESEDDRNLIEAYKDYLSSKSRLNILQSSYLSSRRNMKMDSPDDLDLEALADKSDDDAAINEELEAIEAAKAFLAAAKIKVNEATISARKNWKKDPPPDVIRRMERVRRQKSNLMKIAAAVSDTPSSGIRSRKTYFSYYAALFAWLLVFAFYIGATFYIVKFATLRAKYAEENDNDEAYYIVYWLITAAIVYIYFEHKKFTYRNKQIIERTVYDSSKITVEPTVEPGVLMSYLVAEPLLGFLRFILFPYILLKCSSEDHEEKVHVDELDLAVKDEEHNDKNIRETNTHIVFDMLADIVEAAF